MIKNEISKAVIFNLIFSFSLHAMEKQPIYGSFSGRLSPDAEVVLVKTEVLQNEDLKAYSKKQQNILEFYYDNQRIPVKNLEISLSLGDQIKHGVLCPEIRKTRPTVSTLKSATSLEDLAFMIAHPDFEDGTSKLISKGSFEREFDIRIIETGFDFWLAHLQYGWPSKMNWAGENYLSEEWMTKIKFAGDYNSDVFFIEWITAIHFLQGVCPSDKSIEDCALHLLQSFEEKNSAECRIDYENEFYDNMMNAKIYPYTNLMTSIYWQLIKSRREILEKIENKNNWSGLTKANLPTSIALFTLFRLYSAVDTYKSAFASMKRLQESSGIDLNLKELRKVFSKFL